MDCPHCTKSIHISWQTRPLGEDREVKVKVRTATCPACTRLIVKLSRQGMAQGPGGIGPYFPIEGDITESYVHPRAASRAPVHDSVSSNLAADYGEACLVLADSPKASAALSRRCLQHLLREKAGVDHSDLSKEIQEVIDSGKLPTHLAEGIDAVRNHGNFAAHPLKSKSTGEVVDVEPGEAEWNLDVLEGLFDHYFVQPAALEAKKAALNAKLADLGKPEMKSANNGT